MVTRGNAAAGSPGSGEYAAAVWPPQDRRSMHTDNAEQETTQESSETNLATVSRRGFAVGGLSLAAVLAGARPAHAETMFRPNPPNPPKGPRSGDKPNILVIMADDLGWADLSCYGAPHIKTPNLDRLAREGVRFTQAYSSSSTCSPTRIGLYTGRYPGRTYAGLAEPIATVNEEEGLPDDHPTLASLLHDAGYATTLLGKWHVGHLPWFSPLKSGWDSWFGNLSGGVDYFSKVDFLGAYDLYENDVEYQDLRYYTDIITERTIDFIRRDHGKPWLLNLNYTTPHWPWEGPNDQAESQRLTERALAGDNRAMFHYDGGSVAKYVEMVQDMDAQIGRVMAALRKGGKDRNTIVVFKSDNGGERYSYQWPLRGGKWEVTEGGIRVPTIVRWPARIKGGQVSHMPVVTHDWTRTLVAAGGAQPHPGYPMDGRDLTDYLVGSGREPGGDLFWRVVDQGALRRGKWKYWRANDAEYNMKEERLFDMEADQREEANVAALNPELVAELRDAYNAIAETLLAYPPGRGRFTN